jgi:hypothetical protein
VAGKVEQQGLRPLLECGGERLHHAGGGGRSVHLQGRQAIARVTPIEGIEEIAELGQQWITAGPVVEHLHPVGVRATGEQHDSARAQNASRQLQILLQRDLRPARVRPTPNGDPANRVDRSE